MIRKLALSLAALGALGLGSLAVTAPAAADSIGFGFHVGSGGVNSLYQGSPQFYRDNFGARPHYREHRHYRQHYRPDRRAGRVCDVRRVRTITPGGRVVVRRVQDCYRAPGYYRW